MFQYETKRANDDKKARTKSTGLFVSMCRRLFLSATFAVRQPYYYSVILSMRVQWAHRLGSSTRTIFNANKKINKKKYERIFPIATHHWRDGTRQRLAFVSFIYNNCVFFTILSSTEFSLLRFATQHAEPLYARVATLCCLSVWWVVSIVTPLHRPDPCHCAFRCKCLDQIIATRICMTHCCRLLAINHCFIKST